MTATQDLRGRRGELASRARRGDPSAAKELEALNRRLEAARIARETASDADLYDAELEQQQMKRKRIAHAKGEAAAADQLQSECLKLLEQAEKGLDAVVGQIAEAGEKIKAMGRRVNSIDPSFDIAGYHSMIHDALRQRLTDSGFTQGLKSRDGLTSLANVGHQWSGRLQGVLKLGLARVKRECGVVPS